MSEQLYYVRDSRSIVGNCILWWGKDRCGYVCNIDDAGLYTKEECDRMRTTDIPYRKELVEQVAKRHVDHQYLDQVEDGRARERAEIRKIKLENHRLKEENRIIGIARTYFQYYATDPDIDEIQRIIDGEENPFECECD